MNTTVINQDRKSLTLGRLWMALILLLTIKSLFVVISMRGIQWYYIPFSLVTVVPALMLVSFSFLFKPKGAAIYLIVLDVLLSFLFIADIVYARGYDYILKVSIVMSTDKLSGTGESAFALMRWTDFLILLDIPFLIWFAVKHKAEEGKRRIKTFLLTFFGPLVFTIAAFVLLTANRSLCDYDEHVIFLSPLGNHLYDLYSTAIGSKQDLSEDEETEVEDWFESNAQYLDASEEYEDLHGILKGKNIIVIQTESLESMVLDAEYQGQEITPELNRILEDSIWFTDVHEQVLFGNSCDAELMFLTSTYPISSGSAFMRYGDNTYNAIPKILSSSGYSSLAMHGDDPNFWNRETVYSGFGFLDYVTEESFDYTDEGGMGILDECFFHQATDELDALPDPYFEFLITLSSHIPFELPEECNTMDLEDDGKTDDYMQAIHYTDACIGDFIDNLESSGELDNSAVVIYGDHEGLSKYYGTDFADNDMHVPFIVYIPGLDGFTVDSIGGQVDMLPTLLYLMGVDESEYSYSVMGRNLLGDGAGAVLMASGEIIGECADQDLLENARDIADLVTASDYFLKDN